MAGAGAGAAGVIGGGAGGITTGVPGPGIGGATGGSGITGDGVTTFGEAPGFSGSMTVTLQFLQATAKDII